MQTTRWLGLIAVTTLIIACFFPWVTIESKNIVVSGVSAPGTGFGRPGYFHFLFSIFYLFFLFIGKGGKKRANLFVGAINLAWSIRNYTLISSCYGGVCPVKQTALYVCLATSVLMLVAIVLPDKTPGKNVT